MYGKPVPSVRPFLALLFAAAFVLNCLWEWIQVPAYATMAGFWLLERVRIITVASVADAVVTLGIYAVSALATRQLR